MTDQPFGRPTDYTPELANAICERIANGESLRAICATEGMPDKSTIFRWLAKKEHADFRDQYARAREAQADFLAEEVIDIADETSSDFVQKLGADGQPISVVDHEHIARSRLRVDARKWFVGKVAPKKYGDRVTNVVEGGDKPVEMQTVTNRDRAKALLAVVAKAKAEKRSS